MRYAIAPGPSLCHAGYIPEQRGRGVEAMFMSCILLVPLPGPHVQLGAQHAILTRSIMAHSRIYTPQTCKLRYVGRLSQAFPWPDAKGVGRYGHARAQSRSPIRDHK
jgi:hypothetical protein